MSPRHRPPALPLLACLCLSFQWRYWAGRILNVGWEGGRVASPRVACCGGSGAVTRRYERAGAGAGAGAGLLTFGRHVVATAARYSPRDEVTAAALRPSSGGGGVGVSRGVVGGGIYQWFRRRHARCTCADGANLPLPPLPLHRTDQVSERTGGRWCGPSYHPYPSK